MPGVISYRIAEMGDARFLFYLKNDQGVRDSSILARDGVQWADHCSWVARTLDNRSVGLWLVLEDEIPVGTWRIERLANGESEVAIHLIEPKRRGGLGLKILTDWCRDIGTRWVARIVDSNAASIGLFTKAGFKAYTTGKIDGIAFHLYALGGAN